MHIGINSLIMYYSCESNYVSPITGITLAILKCLLQYLYYRATMVLAVVLPLSCSKRLYISTALSSSPPVSSSVETKYLASFNDRNLYRLDGEYQYGSFRVPATSQGN